TRARDYSATGARRFCPVEGLYPATDPLYSWLRLGAPPLSMNQMDSKDLATNDSTVNQVAQMQEMLRAMENRLTEQIAQSEQRTNTRINQLTARVDDLGTNSGGQRC
ncbi:unnamed protein product, partial [Rhizoctonia solani]